MADWFETHAASIAVSRPDDADVSAPVYATKLGALYHGKSEDVLKSSAMVEHKGKAQLVMTSPPFPLNTKKAYGNYTQKEYVDWFAKFAPILRDMVTEDGSIVIEIGNAWMPGKPVMSTHVLKAFLAFLEEGKLNLCQEFIWYNPARLPSPVEWVNKDRCRVKDAFTRIWWMSPNERPKADNRKVLREYSASMKRLIDTGKYNAGPRPSAHNIGAESFKLDNGGAIPPNVGDVDGVPSIDGSISQGQFDRTMDMIEEYQQATNLLKAANTLSSDGYRKFCLDHATDVHPARMPRSGSKSAHRTFSSDVRLAPVSRKARCMSRIIGDIASVVDQKAATSSSPTCRFGVAGTRISSTGFAVIVSSWRRAVFTSALTVRITEPPVVLPWRRVNVSSSSRQSCRLMSATARLRSPLR